MKEKLFAWRKASDELPEKSGLYLVCTDIGYFSVLNFSAKHKEFNCFDYGDASKAIKVEFWSYIPETPEMLETSNEEFDDAKFCMLTCIQPDEVLLDAIEKVYEQEGSEYDSFEMFCDAFRCNRNGLFSKAQTLANGRLAQFEWKLATASEKIEELQKKVAELDDALESTINFVNSINDFWR